MVVRAVAFALALIVAAPLLAVAGKRWPSAGAPFTIQVIDESGAPVLKAAIVADNGLVCHTTADGATRWTESSVMNRPVRFRVNHEAFAAAQATLSVTHGGQATITVRRP